MIHVVTLSLSRLMQPVDKLRVTIYVALLIAVFVPVAASAKKAHPGPCRQGQVSSLVDRPGAGSATTTSGSPCTVPAHHVVFEVGYRNEVDAGKGGSSNLSTYPMLLERAGVDKHDEIIFVPPALTIRNGNAPPEFTPAVGSQDMGFGFKHAIQSHWWFQDAVQVVVTTPTGTNGYSTGSPTWTFTYVGTFSPPGKLSISTLMAIVNAPGTPPSGPPRRFASYQPAVTLAYSLDASTALQVNDNFSAPVNPAGGTSNVLLVALQRTLSPGVVLDFESESNLTPITGYRQHAIGFGGAFLY